MSDPTLQTILSNVIEMRGELSAVIAEARQDRSDSQGIKNDIELLKEAERTRKIDQKWRYKIAAAIGAVVAFSFEHLPQYVSRGFSSLFHSPPH